MYNSLSCQALPHTHLDFLIAQTMVNVSLELPVTQTMVFVTGTRLDLLRGSTAYLLAEVTQSLSLITPAMDNQFSGAVTLEDALTVLAAIAVLLVVERQMEGL